MNFAALVHFLRELLAERDFVLERIEVEALADAAVANGVDVLLAAGLDVRVVGLNACGHILRWLLAGCGLVLRRCGSLSLRSGSGRSSGLLVWCRVLTAVPLARWPAE